ncbi:MAG TPA: hypothetical protein VFA43_04245 [Gemmatimonadaceae bacterium]|nr:hypothetical protein [Gemmatimonadaceae bacterium]
MRVRGISVKVENTRPDIQTAFVLERLDAALGLIEQYQPWRLAHLRRDVAYIWIKAFPCRGAYLPDPRVVLTELSFLARAAEFTPAIIASSILHEGVHARVARVVRRPRDPAREERLCRRAELAFGLTLPPDLGAPVIERAVASLGLDDADVAPAIDWAAAHAAKASADAKAIAAWRSRS